MPRGGHNRKSNSLHVVEGTYRKDRHGAKVEPKPRPVAPSMPRWLDREGRKQWRSLAPELAKVGLLTVLDGPAFAIYCCLWSDFRRLSEVIDREGMVVEGRRGPVKHPLLPALHHAMDGVLTFSREFGLTPASRSRLSVAEPIDDDSDFEKWLGK